MGPVPVNCMFQAPAKVRQGDQPSDLTPPDFEPVAKCERTTLALPARRTGGSCVVRFPTIAPGRERAGWARRSPARGEKAQGAVLDLLPGNGRALADPRGHGDGSGLVIKLALYIAPYGDVPVHFPDVPQPGLNRRLRAGVGQDFHDSNNCSYNIRFFWFSLFRVWFCEPKRSGKL